MEKVPHHLGETFLQCSGFLVLFDVLSNCSVSLAYEFSQSIYLHGVFLPCEVLSRLLY